MTGTRSAVGWHLRGCIQRDDASAYRTDIWLDDVWLRRKQGQDLARSRHESGGPSCLHNRVDFFPAHDGERGAKYVQIDAVAIELRRQAIEPLGERGIRLLWRDDGLRGRTLRDPKRLTLTNSKAEIERTDTSTVMSCRASAGTLWGALPRQR